MSQAKVHGPGFALTRKRVSLRVLDSSPQRKGRLPLLDQDQQVLTPRLRLLLLILVLYPKLDPSPESLLLPGALV